MQERRDETVAAIEALIDRIVGAAMERPPAERPGYVHAALEAIRANYRRHYADDERSLSDAMAMSMKIEEWVERRLAQIEAKDLGVPDNS